MIDLLLSSGADASVRDVQGRVAANVARGKGVSADLVAKLEASAE